MVKLKNKWAELDSEIRNYIKLFVFVFFGVLSIALIIIFTMLRVNDVISTRNVTHPEPGVTCVELISYKDVSISCVSK